MYLLILFFEDEYNEKITSPFMGLENMPFVPRKGDILDIDFEVAGSDPFYKDFFEKTSEYEDFFNCFFNTEFEVVKVKIPYSTGMDFNKDKAFEVFITLKGNLDRNKFKKYHQSRHPYP